MKMKKKYRIIKRWDGSWMPQYLTWWFPVWRDIRKIYGCKFSYDEAMADIGTHSGEFDVEIGWK